MCKSTPPGTCGCLNSSLARHWLQAYDSRTEDSQQAWRLQKEEKLCGCTNTQQFSRLEPQASDDYLQLFVRTHGKSASPGTPGSLLCSSCVGSFGDQCPNIRDGLSYHIVDPFQSGGLLQGRGYGYCLVGVLGL